VQCYIKKFDIQSNVHEMLILRHEMQKGVHEMQILRHEMQEKGLGFVVWCLVFVSRKGRKGAKSAKGIETPR
jgi:hypothetical protein